MTNNINTLIRKYLSGDISDDEYQLLSETLANDKNTAKHLEQMTEADDLTKRYKEYASVDTDAALQKFIEQYVNEGETDTVKTSEARVFSPRFYRIAAVILILLVGGAFWYHREYTRVTPPVITEEVQLAMEQSRESGRAGADIVSSVTSRQQVISKEECDLYHVDEGFVEQLEEAKRITTRHDKEYWVTLDDGTLVHLNYNSRLIYPEKFGDRRDVILDGEAYFMVAKDKSRKFVVHTPQGDVKVYGTEFYVKTDSSSSTGEGSIVVLVNGSLGFTPPGGKQQKLVPGQLCRIINNQCTVEDVDIELYVAWNTGSFVFDNVPLSKLMAVISRWYDYQVVFNDEKAAQTMFTGNLDKYQSIEPFIEIIEQVTQLDITLKDKLIIIDKK